MLSYLTFKKHINPQLTFKQCEGSQVRSNLFPPSAKTLTKKRRGGGYGIRRWVANPVFVGSKAISFFAKKELGVQERRRLKLLRNGERKAKEIPPLAF